MADRIPAPEVNWRHLAQERIQKTMDIMEANDLDAIIVTCVDNIRYCSDYQVMGVWEFLNDEFASILTKEGQSHLYHVMQPTGNTKKNPFPNNPYITESIGVPAWTPMAVASSIWAELFKKKLEELRAKNIGIENLPYQTYEMIKQKLPNRKFKSIFTELMKARMIKTEDEIKLLEHAAEVNDAAIEAGYNKIKTGTKETDIASAISAEMWKQQVEAISHVDVFSTSAFDNPSERPLQKGDTVAMDTGVFAQGGYTADTARTGFVGKPSGKIADGFKILKDAALKAISAVRPGVRASEIDGIIRRTLKEADYPDTPYSMGHGIGLRLMELPHIDRKELMVEDAELEKNMVICLEPITSVEGRTILFENTILIQDNGHRTLSHGPYPV